MNYRSVLALAVTVIGVSSCFFPIRSFRHSQHPAAPDYSSAGWWGALPDRKDSADLELPAYSIIDGQRHAKADVFFVHPTTYQYGRLWNEGPQKKRVKKTTDEFPVKLQASVFNESCRIYLPYYRNANLFAYVGNKKSAAQAFDLAYADVRAAFLYYLSHYNQGRPFILASHSQGTDHCVRLMKEFLDKDTSLRQRFIVAYLVGRPLQDSVFKTIKVCDSPDETGGYVSWNTVAWGVDAFYGTKQKGIVCVNPLSWKRDTVYVPASANKGGLPFTARKIDPAVADAKAAPSGMLWVHRPNRSRKEYMSIGSPYYHLEDYNFFYMSIRENVKQRVEAFLKEKR